MRIIETLNNDSILVNGKPYGKHYLLIEYSHFIPNTNKKDFIPSYKNCFSLINKYDSFDKIFECEDLNKISINGVFYNSSESLLKAFTALINSNTPVVPPIPIAKIIQSIPMQDALGVLVWKNILDDGTFTYTLQDGTAYAGGTNILQVPDLQTANNTKVISGTAKGLDYTLVAGAYTKTQLATSYGNGLKICYIKALANQDVQNSKVAITTVTDTTITLLDYVEKGSQEKTIKGYTESEDFVLTVQGGNAVVFLTFFNNI